MRKKLYALTLATALALTMPTTAGFYAGAGIGGSFNGGSATTDGIRSSYKNTPAYSLSAGYELPLPLLDIRGEVEYLHAKPNVKYGESRKLDGLMLNAYGVIPFIPLIDPYVGLGIGKVRFDHTNSFAVQGMLGVEYELPIAPITVGAEYRYFKINETTGKINSPSKYHTNILMMKLKYLF